MAYALFSNNEIFQILKKMIFSKNEKQNFHFGYFQKWECIQKMNYLKNRNLELLKNKNKNETFLLWKSKFSIKHLKNDPLTKIWRQIEILIALSSSAHTHQKSNFNTWRILCMWQIFNSTWFYQRETCSKRSML